MHSHAYRQRLVPVVQYMDLVDSMQMLMKCSMVDQNRTVRKYFRWCMRFNHMRANLWFVQHLKFSVCIVEFMKEVSGQM